MDIVLQGTLLGMIATIGTDVWAAIVKHILRLPTANWTLVGRWFGYMPRGVFVHRPVSNSAGIPGELVIGWAAHYIVGIVYGIAYLSLVSVLFSSSPTFTSALAFGLSTLVAPWFIMQPWMGAGVLASKTPRPGLIRLINVSMHTVFGVSLYVAWLLI